MPDEPDEPSHMSLPARLSARGGQASTSDPGEPDGREQWAHAPARAPETAKSAGGGESPADFASLADADEPLPDFLRRLDGREADGAPQTPQPITVRGTDGDIPTVGAGTATSVEGQPARVRSRARAGAALALREAITLGAMLVVVSAVAAAFVWPWLSEPPAGGERLARYAPLRDGDARLTVQEAGDGAARGWTAQNIRLIPGLRVYTDLRKAIGDGFTASLLLPGEASVPDGALHARLGELVIQETRIYEVAGDGSVSDTWQYFARDERGDRFVGMYYPQDDRDLIADPPALIMPSNAEVGATWSSEGKLGNSTYSWSGSILSEGPYDGAAGSFPDCLQVEQRVAIGVGTAPTESVSHDWFCAGIGWVEGQTLEADGALRERTYSLSASGNVAEHAPLPPAAPVLSDVPTLAEPDRWRLTRLGRTKATGETSEATIQPTWIPTDPPLLLAAGFSGDLVAFETSVPDAPARWRFHPSGTVYGQPAFDPATGRVYFGASDKRLYALDSRGLFLWSFATDDNVAARPLVVDSLVVAASEDGEVYGLDAATGRERWAFSSEGGIASWPLLADDTIIVGSDDGTVYGIDPATGRERWKLLASAAVEAPVTLDTTSGVAYVASRDGTLAAFKPADCSESCKNIWSEEPGASLRTAPLIAGGRVVVVDEDGEMIAVRAEDGKRIWSLSGAHYVGAPILVDDAIIVATYQGVVERISLDGARLGRWDVRTALNPADGESSFAYGPVAGGDGIWLADKDAVVRRLGMPPLGGIPALSMAWVGQTTRPPFASNQLRNTALEYRGGAVMVDYARGVFLIDPATGGGSKLTDLPGDGLTAQVDPVLTGDALLTLSGRTMDALDLRTGQPLWQSVAPGTSVRPPVVHGDTVLWANTAEGSGTLLALDAATGVVRWQTSLGSVAQVGGIVAHGDTAYTSTPPAAWDLRTGTARWRANVLGVPLGGPAMSDDGGLIYLAGINQDQSTGMVAALDAATGAVRWQVALDDAIMNPLDQVWVRDGLVVVPELEGKVVVLDAETGAERWRFTPPTDRLGGITVGRGAIWFMLENARLYGLDIQTGRPVARLTELDLSLNGAGLTQRPVFVGDRLIFPAGLIVVGLELPEDRP